MDQVVLFFIILLVFVVNYFFSRKDFEKDEEMFNENQNSEQELKNEEKVEEIDFSKDFFTRVQKGEKYQIFMRIPSQHECYMIQSLLYSAGIPSYTEFEHISGIYGNTAGILNSMFACRLSILIEDYDEAFLIARDYCKQQLERLKEANSKDRIINATETALETLVFSPFSDSKSQEILGMTIYRKEGYDYTE